MNSDSAAVQLLSHLWRDSQEATGHSWLRLNQGLREGLFLAVKIGLEFNGDDLGAIHGRFRGSYWFGANFEDFYQCAVIYANRSAWKAYEAHTKRKPFIYPATLRAHWGGGGQGINNPARLVVGCEFGWNGERVTVTSFNDEKGYLVAQSYTSPQAEVCADCGHQKTWPKNKILRRYVITHADLKAQKADQKKPKGGL